jgi:hypothetical protein
MNMKAIILYQPNSENARTVEEFVQGFKTRTPYDIELINIDTPRGSSLGELYDIVQYPTVLAVREDGQLVKSWAGVPLPLINDVAGHLNTS